jgi:hypothetical protein
VYNQFYGTAYLGAKPAPPARPAAAAAPAPATAPKPATVQPAAPPQNAAKVYKIGDIGPAGGWIFYDKGAYTEGWRYLEAAPRNAGTAEWGLYGKDVAGTKTAVGSGKRNTQVILEALRREGETGKAAQRCAAFEAGGFKDWFLPSKGELDLMYKNLKARGVGNIDGSWYWSSSENNDNNAYVQRFSDGGQSIYDKNNADSVRAVRAF